MLLMLPPAASVHAQVNQPPQNFYVDPLTLHASWDAPDTSLSRDRTIELLDYFVFMDDSLVGITTGTEYDLDSLDLVYGTEHTAGIAAHYTTGMSDTVLYSFTSHYFPQVTDLTANCDSVPMLIWTDPQPYSSFILGYNIYRDGDFVNYFVIIPGPPVIRIYIDEGILPGIYCYSVTAVYDLYYFGFPGEQGESMASDPVCCPFSPGYNLPFFEDWSSGSFDENEWATDGQNWEINVQQGQEPPCASFSWEPATMNYAMGLESYPLHGDTLVCGYIFLEFDIKLDNVNPTGNENMYVQVWDWTSQTYTTIDTFSNVYGSSGWQHQKLDITSLALQQLFKVRFLAVGENSLDILSWRIDNIHVYRDCYTPANLQTNKFEPMGFNITVTWEPTYPHPINQWLHWDNGMNFTSIGTIGHTEFDVAARWEPIQLQEFDGAKIIKVAFFPTDANTSYRVRVWTGTGPANMIVDQPVTDPLINVWNYIELTSPVPIDITQELWVGYSVNTTFGYPAGCDNGPAIDGYGNMINYYGWKTLLEINPELDFNFNIQAYIAYDGAEWLIRSENDNKGKHSDKPLSRSGIFDIYYKLYRSTHSQHYELHAVTPDTFFVDYNLEVGVLYCYKVQNVYVYEGGIDTCVSDFSNIACDLFSSVDESTGSRQILLFPNPATDYLTIKSVEDIKRVTVYSMMGEVLLTKEPETREYRMDVNGFPSGVYYFRIGIPSGNLCHKVVIMH